MQALRRILRVRALVLTLAAVGGGLITPTAAGAQTTPLGSDPVGPISNVTADWQYYQPASDFCVLDQVVEIPSDTQDTQTGSNPACAFSGFTPADSGLYEVKISTPPLCATCVRLFIDYGAIEPCSLGTSSQGHAFYPLSSANPTYSSSPVAHSPNIKNFTNDYLVSPPGSAQSQAFSNVDPHLLTYAADTAHFAHTTVQGPYYIGPWYLNQYGNRVEGAYVDVDLSQATELGQAALDDIYYGAAYNTDPSLCPDTLAKALATGKLTISADTMVTGIEVDSGSGRATGVNYIDSNGNEGSVSGNGIVLAASTVETPRLVLLSIQNGTMPAKLVNTDVVGHHLMTHHFPGAIGWFEDRIDPWRGYWSTRCLDAGTSDPLAPGRSAMATSRTSAPPAGTNR